MKRIIDTKSFIEKAREIHRDKYDYSKVNYVNSQTKVCIICPKHGEFWQTPNVHLDNHGCPKCKAQETGNRLRIKLGDFINKAKQVHADKYDYSKVEYKNTETKVCIICPKHGEFWQTPHAHLSGKGCPKCGIEKISSSRRMTIEEFIFRARQVHGDKYDYSKVEYININRKVCIICPKHGEFWQQPEDHLNGRGCFKCAHELIGLTKKLSIEQFIEKARQVHGYKYDYSSVKYYGYSEKVCIICPKHGEFWQTPNNHLNGSGCPNCSETNMENEIKKLLINNNIPFIYNGKLDFLGKQRLDFYLPNYKIGIECQGIQHFESVEFFGGEEKLLYTQRCDSLKKELCSKNNVKVLYYANYKYNFPYEVYTDKEKLLNEIWKSKNIQNI